MDRKVVLSLIAAVGAVGLSTSAAHAQARRARAFTSTSVNLNQQPVFGGGRILQSFPETILPNGGTIPAPLGSGGIQPVFGGGAIFQALPITRLGNGAIVNTLGSGLAGVQTGNGTFTPLPGSFFPGIGAGFFPGYGYGSPMWGMPLPNYNNVIYPYMPTGQTNLPTVGINVPAGAPAPDYTQPLGAIGNLSDESNDHTRQPAPRSKTRTPREKGTINVAPPREDRVAEDLQAAMNNNPLQEGRVVRVGPGGVQARYRMHGTMETAVFPKDQVFFFKGNGEVATAASASGLRSGDSVLVSPMITAEPVVSRRTKERATSELAARVHDRVEDGATVASDARVLSSTVGGVQEEVAGSRQEFRDNR